MTSWNQMLTTVPESSGFSTNLISESTNQNAVTSVDLNVKESNQPGERSLSNQSKKLPYQANHQVELLHLQAELDALFQQLQSLKQQRQSSAASECEAIETPVLV
jgi:hypothetical protein